MQEPSWKKVTPHNCTVEPHRQEPGTSQHITRNFFKIQKLEHSHSNQSSRTRTLEVVAIYRTEAQTSPPNLRPKPKTSQSKHPTSTYHHVRPSKKYSPRPPRGSRCCSSHKRPQAFQDSRNCKRDENTARPNQHPR